MRSTMSAARRRGHLSRHERQRVARAEAFSRHTPTAGPGAPVVNLSPRELELIERLVRRDRTAVSSALLLIAGIGAGGERRRAVLARAICSPRRAVIAPSARAHAAASLTHVRRALSGIRPALTA